MLGRLPTLQNDPAGHPSAWLQWLAAGVGALVGLGVGLAVGLGVGAGVGPGVGDGVGRATHTLCPVSPTVHADAAHGAQFVLPALPAKESAGHAVHAVTLLSPSAVYTLAVPLY